MTKAHRHIYNFLFDEFRAHPLRFSNKSAASPGELRKSIDSTQKGFQRDMSKWKVTDRALEWQLKQRQGLKPTLACGHSQMRLKPTIGLFFGGQLIIHRVNRYEVTRSHFAVLSFSLTQRSPQFISREKCFSILKSDSQKRKLKPDADIQCLTWLRKKRRLWKEFKKFRKFFANFEKFWRQ